MNHRFLLSLVAIPTLASSVLMMVLMTGLASASESVLARNSASGQASCDISIESQLKSSKLSLHQANVKLMASSAGIPIDVPPADFTTAESDAAVTLFGCDCSSCIGALRQVRNPSFLNGGRGHCWTALQQRVSPEELQSVLQTLEAEEAE
ncbi:MAG: hypothetical protein HC781_02200 [Leptolyngbyaceae cyanobacterium CSU_1_4]|nr:hypothetical protein [Leptolyngbyaceae cyanobacterium CSU_1_4]